MVSIQENAQNMKMQIPQMKCMRRVNAAGNGNGTNSTQHAQHRECKVSPCMYRRVSRAFSVVSYRVA